MDLEKYFEKVVEVLESGIAKKRLLNRFVDLREGKINNNGEYLTRCFYILIKDQVVSLLVVYKLNGEVYFKINPHDGFNHKKSNNTFVRILREIIDCFIESNVKHPSFYVDGIPGGKRTATGTWAAIYDSVMKNNL